MLIAGGPREVEPRLGRLAQGLRHLNGCRQPMLAARLNGILDDLRVLESLLGDVQPAARGAERKIVAADGEDQLLMSARERDVGREGFGPRGRCGGVPPPEVEEKPL